MVRRAVGSQQTQHHTKRNDTGYPHLNDSRLIVAEVGLLLKATGQGHTRSDLEFPRAGE